MATPGSEPPSNWPIIVPGRETMPITAILATHGAKDFSTALRMKGVMASMWVAPLPRRYWYSWCSLC